MSGRARRIAVAWLAVIAVAAPACAAGPDRAAAVRGEAAHAAAAPGAARVFDALLDSARTAGWDTLAIGERIGHFALALEGTPYADGTLEGPGPEVCRISASGFDCVTFMETCLDLARVSGGRDAAPRFADLADAVTFTRYRNGRVDGYTSRLHYTTDWIRENAARGVLEDVTAALGGEPSSPGVGYMSAHPDRYAALRENPGRIRRMRAIEQRLNDRVRYVIPKARVAAIESRLRTGDLIAIATSIDGLDYSHTGLIVRDASGAARFVHASSAHHRVTFDGPLHVYLENGPRSQSGITVLRPRETAR